MDVCGPAADRKGLPIHGQRMRRLDEQRRAEVQGTRRARLAASGGDHAALAASEVVQSTRFPAFAVAYGRDMGMREMDLLTMAQVPTVHSQ